MCLLPLIWVQDLDLWIQSNFLSCHSIDHEIFKYLKSESYSLLKHFKDLVYAPKMQTIIKSTKLILENKRDI